MAIGKPVFLGKGDRVWASDPSRGGKIPDRSRVGVIQDFDMQGRTADVLWDGNVEPQTCLWDELWKITNDPPRVADPAPAPPRQPAGAEQWSDFGLIHQFAFPYPRGLYLGFEVQAGGKTIILEMGFTREILAGGLFRPAIPAEIQMMQAKGWDPDGIKWTWLIPQLRYRIFIGADLIKELLLMWVMGWEPSEEVKAALAQASQEGLDDLKREEIVKNLLKGEGRGGGGGGMVQ